VDKTPHLSVKEDREEGPPEMITRLGKGAPREKGVHKPPQTKESYERKASKERGNLKKRALSHTNEPTNGEHKGRGKNSPPRRRELQKRKGGKRRRKNKHKKMGERRVKNTLFLGGPPGKNFGMGARKVPKPAKKKRKEMGVGTLKKGGPKKKV